MATVSQVMLAWKEPSTIRTGVTAACVGFSCIFSGVVSNTMLLDTTLLLAPYKHRRF
jgi:hypothetical protein